MNMDLEQKGPVTIAQVKQKMTGEQIWGKYLILELSRRKTKDGHEIINLKLGDRTGDIEGMIWDGKQVGPEFEIGRVIGVVGDRGVYNNRPQMLVRRYKLVEEDAELYLAAPPVDISALAERLEGVIASVQDENLQRLLQAIFTPERKIAFQKAPGGRKIHHGYSGGLLEHSLSVAAMCELIASHYTWLNRDLLVSSALLHDVGKIEEYEIRLTPQYTIAGKLIGHIVMGTELLAKTVRELRESGDFPENLSLMLQHILLSHHGTHEWGSPIIPVIPEAFALHLADNLDAKLFIFQNRIQEDNEDPFFSNYDVYFQQQFFKYRYPEVVEVGDMENQSESNEEKKE